MAATLRGQGFGGIWCPGQRCEVAWAGAASPGACNGRVGLASEGTLRLAWHGDFHDLAPLRHDLGLPSEAALGAVLLAGWRRWSTDLFGRLNGAHVLAIAEGDNLVLYRDKSGLRNLYVDTRSAGEVAFATSLSTLQALPSATARVRPAGLHEYLRFLDIAAPATLFDGIAAVEPGQMLRWAGGRLVGQPAPVGAVPPLPSTASLDEAVGALAQALERSIQLRVADASTPAVFLSGGIDSALLCALAARHRPDITAVTVGFDDAQDDESPIAARIAAHLGVRHQILRFDRRQYLDAFDRYAEAADQPMADPAILPTLLAFEHCVPRFDVVLDGTGADESLGMMPARHVRLAVRSANWLPILVRRGLVGALRRVARLAPYARILDFDHPADTMIRWNGFTRTEIEALCGRPVSFEATRFYATYRRLRLASAFDLYSALLDAMPCERLTQAMAITGLDVRYPFCDPATDGLVRQLRTDYRYLPGAPKRIARELLARLVPVQFWDVPKHGFNFPLRRWLAGENGALVQRGVDSTAWRRTGLLDAEHVAALGRRFAASDPAVTFRIWALVVLAAWLDRRPTLR